MKNFIFFKINNYIVSYAIYIWYNIFFKFIQYKLVVISNFACTIFGKIECTEIGNMQCT